MDDTELFVRTTEDRKVHEDEISTYDRYVNFMKNCQIDEKDSLLYCGDNEQGWRFKNDLLLKNYGWSDICKKLIGTSIIHFNAKVKSIEEFSAYVTITLENNTKIKCDGVICALPVGVIDNIKINSIKRSGARPFKTRATKVMIEFVRPFWDLDNSFSGHCEDNTPGSCWEIFNYYKYNRTPVLILECNVSKSDQMDILSDDETLEYALNVIKKATGASPLKVKRFIIKRFTNNEFTKGGLGLRGDFVDSQRICYAGDWDIFESETDGELHNAFYSGRTKALKLLSQLGQNI